MRHLLLVSIVAALALVGCSSSSSSNTDATTPSTTAPASDECGPAPATPRTAILCGLQFDQRSAVHVELHPAAQARVIVVPSAPGLSACPVSRAASFATWPGLDTCLPLDPAQGTALPATASAHVGFVMRATAGAVPNATVSITYTAADGHFVVAPGPGQRALVVGFTPARSDLVGVGVLGPDFGFAADGSGAVKIVQGGQPLPMTKAPPTAKVESNEVARVAPGVPVLAALVPSATDAAMLLEWD
jgi:hypothetical protein